MDECHTSSPTMHKLRSDGMISGIEYGMISGVEFKVDTMSQTMISKEPIEPEVEPSKFDDCFSTVFNFKNIYKELDESSIKLTTTNEIDDSLMDFTTAAWLDTCYEYDPFVTSKIQYTVDENFSMPQPQKDELEANVEVKRNNPTEKEILKINNLDHQQKPKQVQTSSCETEANVKVKCDNPTEEEVLKINNLHHRQKLEQIQSSSCEKEANVEVKRDNPTVIKVLKINSLAHQQKPKQIQSSSCEKEANVEVKRDNPTVIKVLKINSLNRQQKPNQIRSSSCKKEAKIKVKRDKPGIEGLKINSLNRQQKPKSTSCKNCKRQFINENRLRVHMESHCKSGVVKKLYKVDINVWECLNCCQVFATADSAAKHAKNSIAYHIANLCVGELKDSVRKFSTELILQCEFCNRAYTEKKWLLRHQKTHTTSTNYECMLCNETFDDYIKASKHWLMQCLDEPSLFCLPQLLLCECCNKTFISQDSLYKHKLNYRHYTAKRLSTTTNVVRSGCCCKSKEQTVSSRRESNACKYQCERCAVVLNSVQDLVNHHESEHTRKELSQDQKDSKLFECEICDHTFKHPNSVNLHMMRHRGVKQFGCLHEDCEARFVSRADLQEHTSKVHTGERHYKCSVCNAEFLTRAVYHDHLNIHNNDRLYQCDKCEQKFTRKNSLKCHQLVHTRERSNLCEICGKVFTYKENYYRHLRSEHRSECSQ